MSDTSLILAAGTQTRWNYEKLPGIPEIKQLVEVNGEVLIERIQRQFPESIVITRDPEISKHCKKVFKPEHYNVTVATLFSTHELWNGWITILLGDVKYGKQTIRLIDTQKDNLMFYGDRGEIYAIKWSPDVTPLIHWAIHALINRPDWIPKYGKLWNLYRIINNLPYKEHKIDKYFTFVSDCKDFDTQKQYKRYAENQKVRK